MPNAALDGEFVKASVVLDFHVKRPDKCSDAWVLWSVPLKVESMSAVDFAVLHGTPMFVVFCFLLSHFLWFVHKWAIYLLGGGRVRVRVRVDDCVGVKRVPGLFSSGSACVCCGRRCCCSCSCSVRVDVHAGAKRVPGLFSSGPARVGVFGMRFHRS